jgi:hypothetical protein
MHQLQVVHCLFSEGTRVMKNIFRIVGGKPLIALVSVTLLASTPPTCGDERDTIIAEYATYGVGWTPDCADFSQTAHSDHFTFQELNVTGDYSWGVIENALTIPETSSYGLERWRKEYGASRIINSGYRNPKHNSDVGGAKDSRHMYGDAADVRNESGTEDEWSKMQAAASRAKADYIEPREGPCKLACVHADWRATSGAQLNQGERLEKSAADTLNTDVMKKTDDAAERAKMFEDFIQSVSRTQKSNYEEIARILTRTDANRAKRDLIELLTKENALVRGAAKQHLDLSETYTDYYADLIGSVSALHDPAAIGALLDSAPSGWLAIQGLAQFGSVVLEPATRRLQSDRPDERRAAALVVKTVLSAPGFSADEKTRGMLNSAIIHALHDSDGYTRLAALEIVPALTKDEAFRDVVQSLAKTDPFKVGAAYPVRALAKKFLGRYVRNEFESVSLVLVTDGERKYYAGLTLYKNNSWVESEAGGASNVFTTKRGLWSRAVNVVTLFKNDNTTRVGQLRDLLPENARKGDTGGGSSFETGLNFRWTVQ